MNQLHLVFFVIGLLLFGCIALYSYMQQGGLKHWRRKNIDPLIADVDATSAAPASVSADLKKAEANQSEPKIELAEEPQLEVGQHSLEKQSAIEVEEESQPQEALSTKVAPKLQPEEEITLPKLNSEPASTGSSEIVSAKPLFEKSSSNLLTELVAKVRNPGPIEQQELLALFRNHDFKFHRKVHIYGLNELTDMWRDVEFELPSARFLELGISIQLADREGSMTQKELHDFQQMVLAFSNKFDAPFDFSMDLDEALAQANLLDNIGRRYDSMAVLNVVPKARAGFRMADIESCARDLMMSTDKNGIFMKTTGQKNNLSVLYRLACTDDSGQFGVSSGSTTLVHDLVVYMNVPATSDPENVFQDMVKDASNLATWLDGKVVDRNGRGMSQRSYSILMQQVSDIAFSMQQDGLKPGDQVAKKLF